jgi:hypothetical protein
MSTTLVTMFFKLPGARPKEFYLNHGASVLGIQAPMIIFCDCETRADIELIRGDIPTVYIEKRIHEYEYYSTLLPIVRENRKSLPPSDPRNTPEYFLLSVFKFYALMIAYQRADFPRSHYMWIDIGCSHVVRHIPDALYPIINNPKPKVACCYIHYRSTSELYPMKEFMKHGGKCGIAAGIFTVEASYVPRLFSMTNSILYEQIAEGVGHAEEQILIYCHDKHPEWFSLFFGDYYSIASNYHRTVEDKECVEQYFIQNAKHACQVDLYEQAIRSFA